MICPFMLRCVCQRFGIAPLRLPEIDPPSRNLSIHTRPATCKCLKHGVLQQLRQWSEPSRARQQIQHLPYIPTYYAQDPLRVEVCLQSAGWVSPFQESVYDPRHTTWHGVNEVHGSCPETRKIQFGAHWMIKGHLLEHEAVDFRPVWIIKMPFLEMDSNIFNKDKPQYEHAFRLMKCLVV